MSETTTPNKKRIAYLTGEYPRATDTFVQREVDAVRRHGIEVLTFSVRATDASHHVGEEQKREAAATLALLPVAKNPLKLLAAHGRCLAASPGRWLAGLCAAWRLRWPGCAGAAYAVFYFLEAGVLADQLRRGRVLHLHNHFANSSCSVAMAAAAMAGVPFSFTMHGPAIFFEPHHWGVGKKIAAARFVACISHYCRSQAMILSDQDHWAKLNIIHCGIEPERYAAVEHRDEGVRGDGTIRLLFVGRLAAVKGLPVLLDAFAALPERFHLSLIGDGADRPALEAAAAALPGSAAGRVTFEGYKSQDEVAAALGETDVFVLPSFAEGVPVVLMEALASGVPAVATAVAGVGELVLDGANGRIVPPGDAEALREAIEALGRDAALRTRYGRAGRERVERGFDIDSEAGRLADLLLSAESMAVPHPTDSQPGGGGASGTLLLDGPDRIPRTSR